MAVKLVYVNDGSLTDHNLQEKDINSEKSITITVNKEALDNLKSAAEKLKQISWATRARQSFSSVLVPLNMQAMYDAECELEKCLEAINNAEVA